MLCLALALAALCAAASAQAPPVPARCLAQMNAWCNDQSDPAIQACYAAMERMNATFPLYALYCILFHLHVPNPQGMLCDLQVRH
jgi:hypothetical protein